MMKVESNALLCCPLSSCYSFDGFDGSHDQQRLRIGREPITITRSRSVEVDCHNVANHGMVSVWFVGFIDDRSAGCQDPTSVPKLSTLGKGDAARIVAARMDWQRGLAKGDPDGCMSSG